MSFISDFLFGSSPSREQVPTLTPQQQDLLNFIIQNAVSGQSGFGFNQEFFDQSFTEPALREFETRTAPSIQQKFIGAGAGRGSNLQDVLARAGADVQGNLSQKRAELLNNALDRQLKAAGLALGSSAFGTETTPGTTGFIPEALTGIASGFASGLGKPFGQSSANFINRGFRR